MFAYIDLDAIDPDAIDPCAALHLCSGRPRRLAVGWKMNSAGGVTRVAVLQDQGNKVKPMSPLRDTHVRMESKTYETTKRFPVVRKARSLEMSMTFAVPEKGNRFW